jgi:hypothetical protein
LKETYFLIKEKIYPLVSFQGALGLGDHVFALFFYDILPK